MVDKIAYNKLIDELHHKNVTLVAVSKTKPAEDIRVLYNLGQKDFGENYVQELTEKQQLLPAGIRWHFIGHLQGNKVKYIAPFVHIIHGIDSFKLLQEVNKQAAKNNRIIDCLLQVHIAQEETKFGFDENDLQSVTEQMIQEESTFENIKVLGLMGMASFTDDMNKVRNEFKYLRFLFNKYKSYQRKNFNMQILSMGMSSDYTIAVEEGSNMVRIGSLLFGARVYN
jgi:pyridoxal phosphate enzyme (YggS family)